VTPPWMKHARAKLGIRETPGAKHTPAIMAWAMNLGSKVLGIAYGADEIPWCGLFVAQVMAEAGFKSPPIAVRAKAWATWGDPAPAVEGAILVFQRPGGGHVGFYAGETKTAFLVLGGNQGDAVTMAYIAKSRCVAIRWPKGYPVIGGTIAVNAAGPLSTNEA